MRQLRWPLDSLAAAPAVSAPESAARTRALRTRYPIRYLRYWFVRCLLEEEHRRLKRPLRVLEVGIDRGQMPSFLAHRPAGAETSALPAAIERWDGLDVQADPDNLARCGYSDYFEADVERPFDLNGRRYDAVILLHVLEHLNDPEAAMARLLDAVSDSGLIVGGSPTMPGWMGRLHQRALRRKYADRMHDVRIHKHLSVITPPRVRRFASDTGLTPELVAGTFFMRASGSPLENSSLWIRANLLWGALFPSLGGEVYFSLRKARRGAAGPVPAS